MLNTPNHLTLDLTDDIRAIVKEGEYFWIGPAGLMIALSRKEARDCANGARIYLRKEGKAIKIRNK